MSATCPRLGFHVTLTLAGGLDLEAQGELRRVLETWMDERSLTDAQAGPPWTGGSRWRLTLWREGSQADNDDRRAVAQWAASRREIESADIGLLGDLGEQP